MSDPLSRVFGALADPTRRDLVARLTDGDATVGQLAAPYRVSVQAISKHVKVLERAGLVRRRVDGRTHHCRLEATRLAQAQRWLAFYERFWSERLDALEALFAEKKEAK
jgi:DNA-binding transcriptional ArsR family regulator